MKAGGRQNIDQNIELQSSRLLRAATIVVVACVFVLAAIGAIQSENYGARLRLDFEVPTKQGNLADLPDSTQPAEISFDLSSKDLFQDDEVLVDRNSSDAALLSRLEAELHKLSVDQRQEEHRIRKQQQQKESVEASFSSQQMQLPAASQQVGEQHENHIKTDKGG